MTPQTLYLLQLRPAGVLYRFVTTAELPQARLMAREVGQTLHLVKEWPDTDVEQFMKFFNVRYWDSPLMKSGPLHNVLVLYDKEIDEIKALRDLKPGTTGALKMFQHPANKGFNNA